MKKLVAWGAILIASGMLSSACSSMYVERNPNFREGPQIKKIVSIDPSFVYLDTRKNREDIYLKEELLEEKFNLRLISNAKIAKIELQVIDRDELGSSDVDYFNEILPLKRQILAANFLQEVDSRLEGKNSSGVLGLRANASIRAFEQNPTFDPDFGKLSDTYQTPYFAVHGLINLVGKPKADPFMLLFILPIGLIDLFIPESEIVFYSALVNIESGEVLYREVREIYGPANASHLNSLLFDSFKIMKRKIK